jgi:DNA-binding CsgD family transcriptional regulator
VLSGRSAECESLDRLLGTVRAGRRAVLVLRGDPGVGKTSLMDHLRARASDCHVLRATGVPSEMALAFAGLHQLLGPFLDRRERLPEPQRRALGTAFGLSAGDAPDRFLVGLATLGLLAEVSEERPVVCLVDDAQWLDRISAQTLAFVARRLLAEPVALVFAARLPSDALSGLPEMAVEGLRYADARALLDSVVTGPLDERVRNRIIAEARGNPLALLELPRGLSPAQLAGGFGAPDAMTLPRRIEKSFRQRLAPLPAQTRRLLLIAAAEPIGDPALLRDAAARLGIERVETAAAAAADVLEIGAWVGFRHPLVRSAVYRAATPDERRAVHQALADATDPDLDPDRRAWHRAQATSGPDEQVAEELARAAGRVQARGGLAAAAAFLDRSARLTLDPGRRARRALVAAEAENQAGAFDAALDLVAEAEAGPLGELERAQADVLRAQIAFASNRGNEALPLLLKGARRLEPLDARLAGDTYLAAMSAAIFAGRLARGVGPMEVAEAVRAAPLPPPSRPGDQLLEGLALLYAEGYAAAVPTLQRAIAGFRGERLSPEEGLRQLWLACITAALLWDDASWEALSALHLKLARDTGALSELTIALSSRVYVHLFIGELREAAELIEELDGLAQAIGTHLAPYGPLGLAAWRGTDDDVERRVADALADVVVRGEGIGVTVAEWATAVRDNGSGRYERALAAARRASDHRPERAASSNWALVELIEAAARSGEAGDARDALQRLMEVTRASGTDWAAGVEARSRALVSDGDEADALYREAIDRLGRTRARLDLARAHLLYGEWLRRQSRRLDARTQLRTASELFLAAGADAFGERARRELLATGETVRQRTSQARDELTPHEAQIAGLARDGQTNPEIAAQLFLSPRTVEWHLGNVFSKLGISSRRELRGSLQVDDAAAPIG